MCRLTVLSEPYACQQVHHQHARSVSAADGAVRPSLPSMGLPQPELPNTPTPAPPSGPPPSRPALQPLVLQRLGSEGSADSKEELVCAAGSK